MFWLGGGGGAIINTQKGGEDSGITSFSSPIQALQRQIFKFHRDFTSLAGAAARISLLQQMGLLPKAEQIREMKNKGWGKKTTGQIDQSQLLLQLDKL